MDRDPLFAASARERRGIADLLDTLTPAQLDSPSLCAGWSVRVVAGHLVAPLVGSTGAFLRELVRRRGNPHAANDALARRFAARPVAELSAALREHAGSRFAPPVVGAFGPLTDAFVHGGDMRVPLGLPHAPPPDDVQRSLEFVTTGRPVGFVPKGALRGLRLVTTDLDWAWGEGDRLEGRAIDLLMVVCGRAALLPEVSGAGVAVLRERLTG